MHEVQLPEAQSPGSRSDAGKAAMQEWAKGAGKGLRAPGRHLRGPKEKRCRPRWQLPEAQF